jgi:hypothetical protein
MEVNSAVDSKGPADEEDGARTAAWATASVRMEREAPSFMVVLLAMSSASERAFERRV